MTRARDLANRTVRDGSVDTAQLVADAVDNTILDLTDDYAFTGTIGGAGGGKVLQVVTTHFTTTSSQTAANNTDVNITSLSASITPSATTSKIFIMCQWSGETNQYLHNTMFGIKRGTTVVGSPTDGGSRGRGIAHIKAGFYAADNTSTMDGCTWHFLDSPSTTSAITYHGFVRNGGVTKTVYTNRTVNDTNAAGYERAASSITLWEIGT